MAKAQKKDTGIGQRFGIGATPRRRRLSVQMASFVLSWLAAEAVMKISSFFAKCIATLTANHYTSYLQVQISTC